MLRVPVVYIGELFLPFENRKYLGIKHLVGQNGVKLGKTLYKCAMSNRLFYSLDFNACITHLLSRKICENIGVKK